ncbi:hypothetical protein C8F01DRAFT_1256099 [Mycena amicta]|nr:hypothetical protein C8F01DRAFT_1256099 [Mycena amicta]
MSVDIKLSSGVSVTDVERIHHWAHPLRAWFVCVLGALRRLAVPSLDDSKVGQNIPEGYSPATNLLVLQHRKQLSRQYTVFDASILEGFRLDSILRFGVDLFYALETTPLPKFPGIGKKHLTRQVFTLDVVRQIYDDSCSSRSTGRLDRIPGKQLSTLWPIMTGEDMSHDRIPPAVKARKSSFSATLSLRVGLMRIFEAFLNNRRNNDSPGGNNPRRILFSSQTPPCGRSCEAIVPGSAENLETRAIGWTMSDRRPIKASWYAKEEQQSGFTHCTDPTEGLVDVSSTIVLRLQKTTIFMTTIVPEAL